MSQSTNGFEGEPRASPPRPSRLVRTAISVALLLHFSALAIAVLGMGTMLSSPVQFCAAIYPHFSPYLAALKLDNRYHFYAPNVTGETTLWAKVVTETGTDLWLEWPVHRGGAWCEANLREKTGPFIAITFVPAADESEQLVLAPLARTVLASYARKLTTEPAAQQHAKSAVSYIAFFAVSTIAMSPAQARAGMEYDDPRLQRASFVGRFSPSGRPLSTEVRSVSVGDLCALTIESLKAGGHTGPLTETPRTVQLLLKEKPELLNHSIADVRKELARRWES